MEKILKTAVLMDKVLGVLVNNVHTENTLYRYNTLCEHLKNQILYRTWYKLEIPVHYGSKMPSSVSGLYDYLLKDTQNTAIYWRSYNLNDETFLYRINDLYEWKGIKNYFKTNL